MNDVATESRVSSRQRTRWRPRSPPTPPSPCRGPRPCSPPTRARRSPKVSTTSPRGTPGMLASDDLTEAVTAFMEKLPKFTGR